MKVEKKKNRILLYFWLPTGTYNKNLAANLFFFKNVAEFRPFFQWKIHCTGSNHIFQVKIWEKFRPLKKKTAYYIFKN